MKLSRLSSENASLIRRIESTKGDVRLLRQKMEDLAENDNMLCGLVNLEGIHPDVVVDLEELPEKEEEKKDIFEDLEEKEKTEEEKEKKEKVIYDSQLSRAVDLLKGIKAYTGISN